MSDYIRNLLSAELMVSMAAREIIVGAATAEAHKEVDQDTIDDLSSVVQELDAIARDLKAYLDDTD
jgi:hypothetical protein